MDLLSLPVLIIENIMSFLSYDEIARTRLVCRDLDQVCQRQLNRGFIMIERRHAMSLKGVKARLPRRESERRLHRLSRHCDILSAIETRISMLNMTYSKFIEHKMCCFIPGKVIDEIKRVLNIVEREEAPPRAHEVLQELRDISSMAIEHFDDKISPALRKQLQREAAATTAAMTERQIDAQMGHHTMEMMDGQPSALSVLQRRSSMNARLALFLSKQCTKMAKKMSTYRKIAQRERATVAKLTAKVTEQGAAIAELKKRIDECDIKYAELTHTNQAVGGKAIAETSTSEPAPAASVSGQPLRNFASQIKLDLSHLPIGTGKRSHGKSTPNIKPRKPVIRLPSISEEDSTDAGEPKAKQPRLETSEVVRLKRTAEQSPRSRRPASELKSRMTEFIKNKGRRSREVNAPKASDSLAVLGKRKALATLEQSMDLRQSIVIDE